MNQNTFKKEAVGKGLKSLLQNIDADIKKNNIVTNNGVGYSIPSSVGIQRIALDKIIVNPHQPRKDFNETELQQLAESIKIHNIIQPITVTKITHDSYQIISGERRFRASQIAGLKDIPVYIRQAESKQNNLELALLENLQRSDLNAIEIALSYQQLIDECELTHELLAERMSKDRSTITNYLRLLKLPPSIQVAVRNSSISMGHAKCIIGIENLESQMYAFQAIITQNLSVRATENWIKTHILDSQTKKITPSFTKPIQVSSIYKNIEDSFVNFFNSKVELKHDEQKKKGTITIHYFNNDELTEIMKKIGITI